MTRLKVAYSCCTAVFHPQSPLYLDKSFSEGIYVADSVLPFLSPCVKFPSRGQLLQLIGCRGDGVLTSSQQLDAPKEAE